ALFSDAPSPTCCTPACPPEPISFPNSTPRSSSGACHVTFTPSSPRVRLTPVTGGGGVDAAKVSGGGAEGAAVGSVVLPGPFIAPVAITTTTATPTAATAAVISAGRRRREPWLGAEPGPAAGGGPGGRGPGVAA